jgi:hypothetical protein
MAVVKRLHISLEFRDLGINALSGLGDLQFSGLATLKNLFALNIFLVLTS